MIIKKKGVEQIIENEQYMNVEQEIEKRVSGTPETFMDSNIPDLFGLPKFPFTS